MSNEVEPVKRLLERNGPRATGGGSGPGVGNSIPARDCAPRSSLALYNWIRSYTGVSIAQNHVCPEHVPPWEMFKDLYFQRPPIALVLGARGSGKSFLSALHTHIVSRFEERHSTRILGGSRSQSLQIYHALRDLVRDGRGFNGSDSDSMTKLGVEEAVYANGSEVAILPASSKSVRGPHVPSLKLDEVDEIASDLREAAMGMCMNRHGIAPSAVMTSTWHRVGGAMSRLMAEARAGAFPLYTFCAFEVLERCTEERSGPNLEKCCDCALISYCHDVPAGTAPRAKRSDGHYSIDSLIQKMRSTSARTFEADYLCRGPRAEGTWFPEFTTSTHVRERGEYDPAYPVNLAIDPGVFTGAVFFQVVRVVVPKGPAVEEVHVFADYLAEDKTPETNARALLEIAQSRCNGRLDVITTDPAGASRTATGIVVTSEYERVGLRPLRRWPLGPVSDGLALVDSFMHPAEGHPRLFVHPRCTALVQALQSYRRARRGGQWQDYPEDPQHPHEDLVDALRGGLRATYPEGRGGDDRQFQRIHARRIF